MTTSIPNCSRFSSRLPMRMVDVRCSMFDVNSEIVGACDKDLRRCRSCGPLHRSADSSRISQRDGTDCRPAAAEKCAERASFFRGGDYSRQHWNQLCPKRLMKLIGECAA